MPELIFLEGVSGVGKSTMTRALAEELRHRGCSVLKYEEGDADNPIDFFQTAFLTAKEYTQLCARHSAESASLQKRAVFAGDARLIRYARGSVPLFREPLLSELAEREFCYRPRRLVPLEVYSSTYAHVWNDFARALPTSVDFILFDGSLLHHPLNDMMKNYHVSQKQALTHIVALLEALGSVRRSIVYLTADNPEEQLKAARNARGQRAPSNEEIAFWNARFQMDQFILNQISENIRTLNISGNGWERQRSRILRELTLPEKIRFAQGEKM